MKKVVLGLVLGLFVLFAFNQCEKEDPKPDCEINNYGSVKVTNHTGYPLWVDVTWGDVISNYEKKLNNNASYTYNKVPAGSVEVWGSFDGDEWVYDVESLTVCEDMTFTWTLATSKSTEKILQLINDQTGEVVVTKTIKSKNKY